MPSADREPGAARPGRHPPQHAAGRRPAGAGRRPPRAVVYRRRATVLAVAAVVLAAGAFAVTRTGGGAGNASGAGGQAGPNAGRSAGPAAGRSAGPAAGRSGSPSSAPVATTRPAPAAPTTTSVVPAQATVTIAAVGDTMMGNTPRLPPDPPAFFSGIQTQLRGGAQIVFGNLEGTLTDQSGGKCGAHPSGACFAFRAPPGYAQHLAAAGFTVLNNANNHSNDFGPAGQAQTVAALHGAGIAQTGLPGQVTVVAAGPLRVGFVAFAPYHDTANLLDTATARAMIGQARSQADVVVVYMHVGAEGAGATHVTGKEELYVGEDRGNPQAFAHMAIDAGASLVIASGPHVLRGMEFYQGHLVAYSLGNFAGYLNFANGGVLSNSAILDVTLGAKGDFRSGRILPVTLVGPGQPQPGGGGVSMIASLSAQDFGPTAAHVAPDGTITPT